MPSLDELCQRILQIHEDIRWVKILNPQGKITSEAKKNQVEPYLSKDAMETLRTVWIDIIRGIVGKAAQYWGPPKQMHIQFNKVTVFGFPFSGGTLIVTAEPTIPLTMIDKIQDAIKSQVA